MTSKATCSQRNPNLNPLTLGSTASSRTPPMPGRWIAILGAIAVVFAGVLVDVIAKSKGREPQDPMHIEDGILDDIRLKTATIPSDAVVVIRPFSSEGADLGTGQAGGKDSRVEAAKTIQADGPKLLAESFKTKLGSLGPFPQVRVDDGSEPPGNSLVVEGRFTQIDPGSRGKRYWGFGAGKSGLEVGGTVKNGKGELLAEFTQKRIVVMGEFGGSYIPKMRKDCESLGEDIARFLSAWAKGEKLTE